MKRQRKTTATWKRVKDKVESEHCLQKRSNEMVVEQKGLEQKRSRTEQNICMDKNVFLALTAMGISCAVEIKGSQKGLRWCWMLPGAS